MAKQDAYVRYTIRVPADLYELLQEAAGEKSINAEVVARLGSSFDEVSTSVRLPDGMRERIKRAAQRRGRSMAAEIVATLDEAYPDQDFDLGTFLTTLSHDVGAAAPDSEAIDRIVRSANEELERNDALWRVMWHIDKASGKARVTIVAK